MLNIPTELIGSIPRPVKLIDAIAEFNLCAGSGQRERNSHREATGVEYCGPQRCGAGRHARTAEGTGRHFKYFARPNGTTVRAILRVDLVPPLKLARAMVVEPQTVEATDG